MEQRKCAGCCGKNKQKKALFYKHSAFFIMRYYMVSSSFTVLLSSVLVPGSSVWAACILFLMLLCFFTRNKTMAITITTSGSSTGREPISQITAERSHCPTPYRLSENRLLTSSKNVVFEEATVVSRCTSEISRYSVLYSIWLSYIRSCDS